uniref:Putative ribonuclease H-like domain-containing protein n=1 Tax=Tanacetum cinerariifolium TaxID=118510 RepID=A0A6L2MYJ9_TANCI|nr:putative ribonuclease H-like domain-containing protein [Tanacetum cinerariifolium]
MVEEQSFMAIIHQKTDPALLQFCLYSCFLSQVEPKKVSNALQDPSWVEDMQEKLLQFKIQKVWTLVNCPKRVRPIGTKWVLKNKKDERGIVVRNKARLVAQGHTQDEGIDYDEVFALVARIEAIRLFFAYASFMGFTVYQMDVKSAFLYGTIDEEVYVIQPPGFHDPVYPAKVYKVEKAMYGLHLAPKAWYAFLEKSKHNVDFHQIVDFVGASHIRYALTINPTVYVSHIRQFWYTIRIETTDEGTKILATVDGKLKTISESSLRRNLKLNDEEGITDEPASPLGDDSQGEACPTVSGLEAKQDRANIIKSFTLPHDSTPRVTSLAADEGTQDLKIASLKARIKMLEDKDGGVAKTFGEDATIKGRSLETREEAGVEKSTEKDSNDTEELVNVLTSLDAASILTSGEVQVVSVPPATEVPTGSDMVPTASPIFTTSSVVTPYSRQKGKEKMVESDTPKKKRLQEQIDVQMAREMEEQLAREDQRMNEQIARDVEIARIHAEEELQMLIDSLDRNNETVAKYLQEYEHFTADLSIGERI